MGNAKEQSIHSGLMCVKRRSGVTLKEMLKPKLSVWSTLDGGQGLKSYCCEIKFQLCGAESCRTTTDQTRPGRIVVFLGEEVGKDGQKAAFVIFTLHWRGIYFVWPFVSDDLGRRTAKTQASVKIKLVSTYSLNPPHLTRIPFVFPMHGCGWVFHTIVITFLGAARK